ncbi:MAG TPA: enoyl-CoA hydratase-related protein [Candidatus Baltobacteraceae bacterium]|jgi:methylglutaconyl-CoA hydratase
MSTAVLSIRNEDGIARVALARPDVRNAFNAQLIAELQDAFNRFSADAATRAVVLSGEGKTFCGGADINWMRASLDLSRHENVADARAMSDMFRAIDRCGKPVIGAIHGAALGGGAGLAAVCDIVVASDETIFGFTEVKLGIIPAVISPFVLAKIGVSHARALFLTGERFDARRAQAIGLVHEVTPLGALDAAVDRILAEIRSAGPGAVAAAKRLIETIRESDYAASRDITADAIAAQRTTPEGQEGLRAFLERRKTEWTQ